MRVSKLYTQTISTHVEQINVSKLSPSLFNSDRSRVDNFYHQLFSKTSVGKSQAAHTQDTDKNNEFLVSWRGRVQNSFSIKQPRQERALLRVGSQLPSPEIRKPAARRFSRKISDSRNNSLRSSRKCFAVLQTSKRATENWFEFFMPRAVFQATNHHSGGSSVKLVTNLRGDAAAVISQLPKSSSESPARRLFSPGKLRIFIAFPALSFDISISSGGKKDV